MDIKKDDFYIKKIDKSLANSIVIEHHYLHRKPQNKYSFGLFHKSDNKIVGVIIYGIPASRSLTIGICGEEYANEVLELNRLWVSDKVGRNGESFLIANSIKLLKEKIIVSYSEKERGHVGLVYQASNFYYTGLSDKRKEVKIKGFENRHSKSISDMIVSKYGTFENARKCLGDKLIDVERPRKHRYVYFNCDKRTKKVLLKALNYKIQDYPKATSKAVKTVEESELTNLPLFF